MTPATCPILMYYSWIEREPGEAQRRADALYEQMAPKYPHVPASELRREAEDAVRRAQNYR